MKEYDVVLWAQHGLFATGDNLALFSKRQGFDPRVSMSGGNSSYGGYSPMRTITGGINITF